MANRKATRKIAVIDFETDPFKHGRMPRSFAAGYYDGDDYVEFWGPDCNARLGDFLLTQNAVVYAHNGGKFDFFYLLNYINYQDHDDTKFKLINGRIAIAQIGDCELRDSYLILPMALSSFKKDDISYDIFEEDEREKPANKAEIKKYLKGDCLYLHEWVSGFIERFGRRLTVAGAAFNELGKTDYLVNRRTSELYDETFRPFYYGGRCEAIKPGVHKGHFKYIDINSAYPYAMLSNHPYGPKYVTYSGDDIGQELPDNECYFARIEAVSQGCLPIRDEKTKAISFPNDNDNEPREYNASGWEICAGLDTGTLKVTNIINVYVHEEIKDFGEYVRKWYAEKKLAKSEKEKAEKKGDTKLAGEWAAKEIHAKLMLNAAYGKFGQDGSQYRSYHLYPTGFNPLSDEDRDMAKQLKVSPGEYLTEWLGWVEESETPAGFTIWSKPDPVDDFYNVATAASITAYVRAYLWRAICETKKPVYCDTDSIICQDFNGEIGDELGQWSLDAETKKKGTVYIGGKKLYTFMDKENENHRAHKGARLTHDDIVTIVRDGKTFEWFNDAPSFSLKFGIYPDVDLIKKNPNSKRTGFVRRKIRRTA